MTRTQAKKRVAIVGNAPGARWPRRGEAWGINTWSTQRPCPGTRWFQMHPDEGRSMREDLWLRDCPVPIYTLTDLRAQYPRSRPYPLKAIPPGPLASSFDYMLALAIVEGFIHITISGCALQQGYPRERLLEHVSLAYWIGLARGRGIRVTIEGEGVLHFPYKYGYDYQAERTFGQRMAFWALLANVSGQFDDGQAKTRVKGWRAVRTPQKVAISI